MRSKDIGYLKLALAGGAVLIGVGVVIAGCGTSQNEGPSTTTITTTVTATTPPSSTAPPSPTEKGLNPTGGNSFSPQVKAPPAPTEPPGVHRHRNR